MNAERIIRMRRQLLSPWAIAGVSFLIFLTAAPLFLAPYTIISITNILMYLVMTVSWAFFSGPTQYLSLATAAFFGIGIYVSALTGEVLPFPFVITLGGLASFAIAALVGLSTLRLRGMYFTIFTFGLSEIIRHFILWWEVNRTGTVGRWVVSVDHTTVYYAMLTICAVTLAVTQTVRISKYGLALRSIGDSEEAADHMGINVTTVKLVFFAISAVFSGAAGAAMATRWTYIDPSIAFNPLYSFMPVLMAIFGGITRIHGQIIGAVILTLLADMLLTTFPYYYMLLYGTILVVVILFVPGGLAGLQNDLIRIWQGVSEK